MSNPKTAQEWKDAAAKLELQRRTQVEIANSERPLLSQLFERAQNSIKLQMDINSKLANPNLTASERQTLLAAKSAAETVETNTSIEISKLESRIADAAKQVATLDRQIDKANDEAAKAESGESQTQTNTSPANSNPGSNTQPAELQTLPIDSGRQPNPVTDFTSAQTFPVVSQPVITSRPLNPSDGGGTAGSTPTALPPAANTTQQLNPAQGGGTAGTTPVATPNPTYFQPPITFPGEGEVTVSGVPSFDRALSAVPTVDPTTGVSTTSADTRVASSSPQSVADSRTIDPTASRVTSSEPAAVSSDDPINALYQLTDGFNRPTVAQPATTSEPTRSVGSTATVRVNTGAQAGAANRGNNRQNVRAPAVQKVPDFRIKISLAPSANYLYKDAREGDILWPLKRTQGVIFPYTPQVQVSYSANYEVNDIVHSNYKTYNYRNSSVENIQITGDFTAQDTAEANYLLAVIHFFRSATKMFYGQDENPKAGIPPPLCYLNGYGKFSFNNHPILLQSFTLTYPTDVDYINAGARPLIGQQLTAFTGPSRIQRLKRTGLAPGGITSKVAAFNPLSNAEDITRVPTKITISVSALAVVTRADMSNKFSLKQYANGSLLQKGFW